MPDYVVFNAENGGFAASGQNLVFLADLNAGGPAQAFFFTDADLNSGNVIFTVALNIGPGSIALPAGATLRLQRVRLRQLLHRQPHRRDRGHAIHAGATALRRGGSAVRHGRRARHATLGVTQATLPDTSSSELGLLMMYRRNADKEADAIRIR